MKKTREMSKGKLQSLSTRIRKENEGRKIVKELKILVERKKEAAKPKACRKI